MLNKVKQLIRKLSGADRRAERRRRKEYSSYLRKTLDEQEEYLRKLDDIKRDYEHYKFWHK